MINKLKIDGFDIQVWTTDYADPPCVAVNMSQAIIALDGHELTEEEKTDVTELMASYCRLVDERRLTGYGDNEFQAIVNLFLRGTNMAKEFIKSINER